MARGIVYTTAVACRDCARPIQAARPTRRYCDPCRHRRRATTYLDAAYRELCAWDGGVAD